MGEPMCRASRTIALIASAGLLALSAKANAQSDSTKNWRFAVTPYGWLPQLDGKVGVGPVAANVNIGVSDILDNLKFAIMGTLEARKESWLISADGIYVKLGEEQVIAFRGDTGSLNLDQHLTIIQPLGGYTIGDNETAVDFVGGFRYWNLGASLNVDTSRRPSNEHSGGRSWVDATAGFRLRWVPVRWFHFVAAGDGGGGGAKSTWQAFSSADFVPWTYWTLGLSYRFLSVDYDRSNFLFDSELKGFAIGATYRWQH